MFKRFFNYSYKELKKIESIADKVIKLESALEKLTDDELKGKTEIFRDRLQKGETLDDILVEAYAVCREMSFRVLKMKPFKVQIMGAIALHKGNIAEMKTGEGKTLTSTMPSYLNGLSGNGVHVITVNQYLASRDAEEMGVLFNALGLTVGINSRDLTKSQKREQYECDITYTTNSELGFDYLRDHMVMYEKELVISKGLNFALIDEVDSILIDEARTPLIISGGSKKTQNLYDLTNKIVTRLEEGDFEIEEKSKHASLTENGIHKVEKLLNIDNLYDVKHVQLTHRLNNALRANYIFTKDVEYVVVDGEVLIVDSFTGRIMKGRQYSDGLHQAIEAKEGVKVKNETSTIATITYQNFFRMYSKLSGMTGTAKTEEEEFREIYNMYVIEIPTNKPIIRKDLKDTIFFTEDAKYKYMALEIKRLNDNGQPVLVGTTSIEASEKISNLLTKNGVSHELLNAKQHEREAFIVENAGQLGSVTIATNMAGRGTDIKLGDGVIEAGGLAVIGTERHESRRIDNQLRGRSGRQGDPGYSRFFISCEDDLSRRFMGDFFKNSIRRLTKSKGTDEESPLESKMITRAIESAQTKVEGYNYDSRKNVLRYDEVLNKQRQLMYKQREDILTEESIEDLVINMMQKSVENTVNSFNTFDDKSKKQSIDYEGCFRYFDGNIFPENVITVEEIDSKKIDEVQDFFKDKTMELLANKKQEISEENFNEFLKVVCLKVVDTRWTEHIDQMAALRQSVGLQSYGQVNPIREYQSIGFDLFQTMTDRISSEITKFVIRAEMKKNLQREETVKETGTNSKDESVKKSPKVKKNKVDRNSLCTCGSGLKYKKCCGKNK